MKKTLSLELACLGFACAVGVFSCGPGLVERRPQPLRFEGPFVDAWGQGVVVQERGAGHLRTRVTTNGRGDPSFLRNRHALASPLDLSGKFVRTWIRVDRLDRLAGLELRLSSDGFQKSYFAHTIPLFSDPEFSIVKESTWIPISVGFGSFRQEGEPDRRAIDSVGLYVADLGAGPVQMEWGGTEIIPVAEEGFLSLTFDDGYEEHFTVAARAMAEHGFAGTAYVMPDEIGTPGFMNLRQVEELYRKYKWDLAAHHAVPFTTMSRGDLEDTILGVQRFLQEHDLGHGFQHLALPLGKHDPEIVMPVVRKHFQTVRVAGGGTETLPPADRHKLRVVNVLDSTTPGEIGEAARRARGNGEWLILMFHYLVEGEPENELQYQADTFEEALEAVEDSGIRVRTVSEVWKSAS